jgi:hypothetical protein
MNSIMDTSGNEIVFISAEHDISGNDMTECVYYVLNPPDIECYEMDKPPMNDDDMFALRKLPLSLEFSRLEYIQKPQ